MCNISVILGADCMAPMTKTPATPEHSTSPKATKAGGEAVLVQYLEMWERKLKTLQRRHPERWSVRGWSDEEVRDALTLHLFETVHRGDLVGGSDEAQRDRAEARGGADDCALGLLARRVRELQCGSRLDVTVMDLSDAPLLQREPSHEERYLQEEDEKRRAIAAARARESLNRPQRLWLAAMQWTANRGDFFESSERLNLSAASRVIGKNRSSATRAYKELQSRFQDELDRLE